MRGLLRRQRLFLLPLLCLTTAFAQQPARPIAAPESVSVTATEPLPLDAPDRSVRSFATDDPQLQPLFNAPTDYLRLDPSITLQERGPANVQADLSIRGTTFEQTLVLVDGLRLNDSETGHLNLDLSIPLEAISRIDVLHGAGSTFFGSDAIGGAVNLITTAPNHASATLRLGGGSFYGTEQHLQAALVHGAIATRLTASRDSSDGFTYQGQGDRGYHANVLSLDSFLTLSPKLGPTEILLGGSDRPYGANLFYGPFNSSERTKGWFAALRQPLPAGLQADFAFRRHTDLFVLFAGRPAVYENNHRDSLWQADLRGSVTTAPHLTLAYGLEADGDAIQSNNLGHHARNQGAGYANITWTSLRRLTLAAGAREEVYGGPQQVFAPSASVGFYLGHGLRAHAAAGRGFRLPTYVDLFYSDPTTIGNPTLRPETGASYEGGFDWAPNVGSVGGRPRLEVKTTAFTLRQTNAIDYSKFHLADRYQATNVGKLTYSGVEASATFRFSPDQQFDLGYTLVHTAPPPAGLISEYAFNYASNNASFAWQGSFPKAQLAARTQVSVVQQVARAAYPLWTLALTRNSGFVRPYIRADDLANISYQELPQVPLPGRTLAAGITLTWPQR